MSVAFRAFPSSGIVAIYEEASGGGDILDIDSDCNRPAKYPEDWLGNVLFHSDFDYMDVAFTETGITVNHASVSASSTPSGMVGGQFGWSNTVTDHLLFTHDLGYVPYALVAFGDEMLSPGMPVQGDVSGGLRMCVPYCTSTEVRLIEFASAGASLLAAADIDYSVLVVRQPPAATGSKLIDIDPVAGTFTMGMEKFDFNRQYLQVVPGGSPFSLSLGKTIDLDNGAPRFVTPGGTTYDPVPAIFFYITPVVTSSPGPSIEYGGSFTGDGSFLVQAP